LRKQSKREISQEWKEKLKEEKDVQAKRKTQRERRGYKVQRKSKNEIKESLFKSELHWEWRGGRQW